MTSANEKRNVQVITEMQSKQETEKVAMISAPKPVLLTEDNEIQRTRKILLIILGVCLGLAVASTITVLSGAVSESRIGNGRQSSQVIACLISTFFNIFGICVAYSYSQVGLRVFAALGITKLVLMSLRARLVLFLAVGVLSMVDHAGEGESKASIIAASLGAGIIILVCALDFILTVIMVKFAFKWARLIDANRQLTTQQV